MPTWNITVPAETAMGGTGGSGSNTHDVSGSRPSDFDGATINSVTLSGTGNVTLNTGSSNDTIGVRWCIENSSGTDTYGGVSSDAGSVAYAPVTLFSSLPAAQAAGGSPSPAPTTATAADWHQVNCSWTYAVAGKNDESTADSASFTIVVDYTPEGQQDASGSADMPAFTASGAAVVKHAASGAATLAALAVTASAAHIWPDVWLNTTESKSGADQMTVTAASATSITFSDPSGGKTGSLKLGVERADGEIDWIAVTVNTDGETASGSANLGAFTASGAVTKKFDVSGTPSLPALTASGATTSTHPASGTPSLPALTASGATSTTHPASGSADLGAFTASGAIKKINPASGSANLVAMTASGATATTHPASGTPSLPALTASGSTTLTRHVSGTPSLPAMTASGSVTVTHPASGSASLGAFTASGAASAAGTVSVSGSASLAALTASGAATIKHQVSARTATNLLLYSQQFNSWNTLNADIDINAATAPNGTSTAERLKDPNSSGATDVAAYSTALSEALPSTTQHTLSVYAKADGLDWLFLRWSDGGFGEGRCYYDLTNGTAGTPAGELLSSLSGNITDVGDGWYRCELTFTTQVGGAGTAYIQVAEADGDKIVDRDGTSSIFIWQAQLTEGSWAGVDILSGASQGSKSLITVPSLTASGTTTITNPVSGSANLPALTASGATTTTHPTSGSANLPALTASGSASAAVPDVTASGSATLGAMTASGAAIIAPRVWLNSTQTLSGATEMTVTAYNTAGTSVTFQDPIGAPTGSLFLGVENRNVGGGDSNTGWIAVTVGSPSGSATLPAFTASGLANVFFGTPGIAILPAFTASGSTILTRHASGTPSLPALTASGSAFVTRHASGSATLPALTASGNAARASTASGSVTLPALTASGSATLVGRKTASGSASLGAFTASGAVTVPYKLTGSADLAALTASGAATVKHFASGSVELPAFTANGLLVAGAAPVSGSATLGAMTASGAVTLKHVASGSLQLPSFTASGSVAVFYTARGSVELPALTASGAGIVKRKRTASGSASMPAMTARGVVFRPGDPEGDAGLGQIYRYEWVWDLYDV